LTKPKRYKRYSAEFKREALVRASEDGMTDNAVVESFFGLLKRERANRVRYRTRDEARADLFEYIEVFYNRKRRHGYLGKVSPADFKERSAGSFESVH
jgi:putative transposase